VGHLCNRTPASLLHSTTQDHLPSSAAKQHLQYSNHAAAVSPRRLPWTRSRQPPIFHSQAHKRASRSLVHSPAAICRRAPKPDTPGTHPHSLLLNTSGDNTNKSKHDLSVQSSTQNRQGRPCVQRGLSLPHSASEHQLDGHSARQKRKNNSDLTGPRADLALSVAVPVPSDSTRGPPHIKINGAHAKQSCWATGCSAQVLRRLAVQQGCEPGPCALTSRTGQWTGWQRRARAAAPRPAPARCLAWTRSRAAAPKGPARPRSGSGCWSTRRARAGAAGRGGGGGRGARARAAAGAARAPPASAPPAPARSSAAAAAALRPPLPKPPRGASSAAGPAAAPPPAASAAARAAPGAAGCGGCSAATAVAARALAAPAYAPAARWAPGPSAGTSASPASAPPACGAAQPRPGVCAGSALILSWQPPATRHGVRATHFRGSVLARCTNTPAAGACMPSKHS